MVQQHERLKIWQKSYDLAKDLMETTMRFPRPQQTNGLGSEIRRTALDVLETVMLANDTKRVAVHKDLDQTIDRLQVLVRMSRDLGYVSTGQYGLISERIVEIGRMNGGWMKKAGTFDRDPRASIASWIGYAQHADTYGLNCQIAERHPFLRVAFDPVEAL